MRTIQPWVTSDRSALRRCWSPAEAAIADEFLAHADGAFRRHVGEVAPAVILVKVKAGKITHDHQVKVAVAVEVRQRRAVNTAPAFWA